MKTRVVKWLLFFLICSSSSLLHSSSQAVPFISSSKVSHHHYVNPLMEEKQLNKNAFKRHERMMKTLHNEEMNAREDAGEENKKGKGTYGGGELLRPRARKSGANSLLLKSSPFMLRYLLLIGFHLATIFFF